MSHDAAIPNDNTVARARALYIVSVASFPVVLAGLLTLLVFGSGAIDRGDGIGHKTEFAEFRYPVPGNLVGDRFKLSGEIKAVPDGETVYLVEESEGRYWPKKHLGSSSVGFSRDQVASSGTGYKYTVVLLSVASAGESQIEQWFKQGRETGKYPGITKIEGASPLARIRIIHQ